MPRIRSIKPEFWDSERVGKMSPLARLTYLGLVSLADDEGRGRGEIDWLAGRLHGYDASARKGFPAAVAEIVSAGKVLFYDVGGCKYYSINNFLKHQVINRAYSSKLPEPPHEDSRSIHGTLTERSLNAHGGNREQGTGNREHPPTPFADEGGATAAPKKRPLRRKPLEPTTETLNLVDHPELRPAPEQVDSYIAAKFPEFADGQIGSIFVAHYQENGWYRANGKPVIDWKATLYKNWIVKRMGA